MAKKKVCITGIGGQLGSYLAEYYVNKDYEVHGMVRRASTINTERLANIYKDPHENSNLKLYYGDLSDYGSIIDLVAKIKPDYFINAAAQSHVKVSFDIPEYTSDITGTGVIRCLEAIRKFSPESKFLQLSSSEIFGISPPPQNENTPMIPASPYGCAKLFGYHCVRNYREAYNLWAANAICFNYESSRRLKTFVTAKIVDGLCKYKKGLQKKLYLGNLEARRDWLSVFDVVRGIDLILESNQSNDYCLASGKSYSVKDFLDKVSEKLNIDWRNCVEIDPNYFRPLEVESLCGSYEKIKNDLGWEPQWTLDMIIDEMIDTKMKELSE